MSWQKCPVCNGTGHSEGIGFPTAGPCTVCNGFKIINELTGQPPYKTVTTTSTTIDPEFLKDLKKL